MSIDHWACRFENEVVWDAFMKERSYTRAELRKLALRKEEEHAALYTDDISRGFPPFCVNWPSFLRDEWRDVALSLAGFLARLEDWEKKDPLLFRNFSLKEKGD